MRAAGIEQFGANVQELALADPRVLAADEVMIEVRAAGVGNWDDVVRRGEWDIGPSPPMALGVEASGVITATGNEVSGWSVGDTVMTHPLPLRDGGTWSERLIAAADLLAPKPAAASWEAAACFPVPALTAYQALSEAIQFRSGERILIHGAGGVTGRLMVELARMAGVSVIATAGPRSVDALSSLGVEAVLDYHDEGWPQAVRDLTNGNGVAGAINAAIGDERKTLTTIVDGGRLATITGSPPEPERGIAVENVYVRADGGQLRQLAARFASGALTIAIGATFELACASNALELVTGRGAGGAVAVTP